MSGGGPVADVIVIGWHGRAALAYGLSREGQAVTLWMGDNASAPPRPWSRLGAGQKSFASLCAVDAGVSRPLACLATHFSRRPPSTWATESPVA